MSNQRPRHGTVFKREIRQNDLYREQTSDGFKRMRRRIMFSDQWENDYMEFIEQNPLTLCSGLSYRGKSNKLEHAQRMNALIFDLDGVGLKELRNLFLRFGGDPTRLRRLPMPTYLVLSGTGLHVCYFFREPIDLYPNIKIQLKSLKYDLTFRMWEYGATSQNKEIQYQSINQSFRMVGSIIMIHVSLSTRKPSLNSTLKKPQSWLISVQRYSTLPVCNQPNTQVFLFV